MSKNDKIITNTTCFQAHNQYNVKCMREKCPYWISKPEHNNCVHIAAKNKTHTFQEIGELFGLTRMRICQMEKEILTQIRRSIDHEVNQ